MIYGEDIKAGDGLLQLYSVWTHPEDAENELERLKSEVKSVEFQIEPVEINQPSNEPIF